jgi:hypothetical protein
LLLPVSHSRKALENGFTLSDTHQQQNARFASDIESEHPRARDTSYDFALVAEGYVSLQMVKRPISDHVSPPSYDTSTMYVLQSTVPPVPELPPLPLGPQDLSRCIVPKPVRPDT